MAVNIKLQLINRSSLGELAELIENNFTQIIEKITDKIPVSDVIVSVFKDPKHTISEVGIGGYTPNANTLFVYLDVSHPNLNKHLVEELTATLAHELHHCLRWRNPGYGETLFEALITEGLADHFELEITKMKPRPWDKALSAKQIPEILKRAALEYDNKEYSHEDWFFGNKQRDLPRWTGYTLGFHLVSEYLKNGTRKASELYDVSIEKFKKS